MRSVLFCAAALLGSAALAGERTFDPATFPVDQLPPGFHNAVGGNGKPGEWKVITDESASGKRPVIAQLSRETVDEHFPMLIYDGEVYGDFKFSTRFKIVSGDVGQMAGIVFRFKDEKNYYVLLASALDKRFWFFKMENGERGLLIGPKVQLDKGEWHEMAVECAGTKIHCWLDGQEIIPMLNDATFSSGRIGFWTKSDSVSYFTDAKITFTPRETMAQALMRDALREYPRVLDLQMFAVRPGQKELAVVAAKDEKTLNQPGGKTERAVLDEDTPYFLKEKGTVIVTMPLHDRNGETIAALRVVLKSFSGQTQDNAVVRAQTIVKHIQARVQTREELLQ